MKFSWNGHFAAVKINYTGQLNGQFVLAGHHWTLNHCTIVTLAIFTALVTVVSTEKTFAKRNSLCPNAEI